MSLLTSLIETALGMFQEIYSVCAPVCEMMTPKHKWINYVDICIPIRLIKWFIYSNVLPILHFIWQISYIACVIATLCWLPSCLTFWKWTRNEVAVFFVWLCFAGSFYQCQCLFISNDAFQIFCCISSNYNAVGSFSRNSDQIHMASEFGPRC